MTVYKKSLLKLAKRFEPHQGEASTGGRFLEDEDVEKLKHDLSKAEHRAKQLQKLKDELEEAGADPLPGNWREEISRLEKDAVNKYAGRSDGVYSIDSNKISELKQISDKVFMLNGGRHIANALYDLISDIEISGDA